MKRLFSSFLLLLFAITAAVAQKPELPGEIVDAFQKKYKTDFMIYTWRMLDGNYVAHFSHNAINKYCSLTPKGQWLEEGEAFDKDMIPEEVTNALPKLDITAFILDAYRARLINGTNGYLIIFETEKERHEFWVEETGGKIHRQHTYPIPKQEEVEKPKGNTNDVDWGDGKW